MGKVRIQNKVQFIELSFCFFVDEQVFPSYICAWYGILASSPSEHLSCIHFDHLSVLELGILLYLPFWQ